jgi:hypothetical protein
MLNSLPGGERRIIHAVLPVGDLRQQLRHIFDAGMKRGLELRGCCQPAPTVTKAGPRPFEDDEWDG